MHYLLEDSDLDIYDPRVSPILFENFADLPPAIVATAGFDPLRDEGELYAAALRKAGTVTDLRRYGSLLHAFANFDALGGTAPSHLPRSHRQSRRICATSGSRLR